MLVLKRRASESIIIGEGANAVEVIILPPDDDSTRVGIKAPHSIRVLRKELLDNDSKGNK